MIAQKKEKVKPPQVKENIFEQAKTIPILDITARYTGVSLKKTGKTYTGLCPFHKEKRASFIVNPDKNSFRCYSCGAYGDGIDLVAKVFNISPLEAAKQICRDFGLPVAGMSSQAVRERMAKVGRKRELEQWVNEQVLGLYMELCNYYRIINLVLDTCGWPAYLEFNQWVYCLPVIEDFLDVLSRGTIKQKIKVVMFVAGR